MTKKITEEKLDEWEERLNKEILALPGFPREEHPFDFALSCIAEIRRLREELISAKAMSGLNFKSAGNLREEVVRLRSIVGKMPKTADGVAFEDGMNLYDRDGHVFEVHVEHLGIDNYTHMPIGCLYSTKEAAKKARLNNEK